MNKILILFVFIAMVNSASTYINLYQTPVDNLYDSAVSIGNISLPPIFPGESGVLGIEIENTGGSYLRDISVVFNPDINKNNNNYYYGQADQRLPIIPTGATQYFIKYIPKDSKETAYYEIAAQPTVKPGMYLVRLEISYSLNDSSKVTTKIIGIPVGAARRPMIDIKNILVKPEFPAPGQIINLSFDVVNAKNAAAKDLLITLNYPQPKQVGLFGSGGEASSSPIVALGASTISVGDINSGEKKEVSFILAVPSSLETGPYSLKVLLSYLDQNGFEQSVSRDIGIYVKGNPGIDVTIPEATSHSPYTTAKIKINNPGTGEAKNVKISVLENEYFSPRKTDFVSSVLGRNDVVDTDIDFYAKVQKTGTYPVLLKLTYLDPMGNTIEKTLTTDVYLTETSTIGGFILLLIIIGIPCYFISKKYRLAGKVKGWIKKDGATKDATTAKTLTSEKNIGVPSRPLVTSDFLKTQKIKESEASQKYIINSSPDMKKQSGTR